MDSFVPESSDSASSEVGVVKVVLEVCVSLKQEYEGYVLHIYQQVVWSRQLTSSPVEVLGGHEGLGLPVLRGSGQDRGPFSFCRGLSRTFQSL